MDDALTHPRWNDSLGDPLDLYRGPVVFDNGGGSVVGDGQVWLGWLPSPRVFVSWGFDHPAGWEFIGRPDTLQIGLPETSGAGQVLLQGSPDPPHQVGGPSTVTLSGTVDRLIIGSPEESTPKVQFLVINGPELLGQRLSDDRGGFWAGRTVLESGDLRFVLDQRRDMSTVKGDLEWTCPFGLTHTGELTRLDGGSIDFDETRDALDLLGYFLSFVRGAAVAAVLPCGLNPSDQVVWEDWGSANRTVHPWKTKISWFDSTLTKHLSQLFGGFGRRWSDSDDQQVLRYVLAFYQGSNDPRPLQTALTLAVAGLELMAWVDLVRDGSMPESDFEDHGARAKTIKQLLDAVGIDTTRIPDRLPELRRDGRLGHDAIWNLRTRFTHPRMGSIATDYDLLSEAWRLSTWYLELVLLHWFGYNGPYGSRLRPGRWQGDVDRTPWSPPN